MVPRLLAAVGGRAGVHRFRYHKKPIPATFVNLDSGGVPRITRERSREVTGRLEREGLLADAGNQQGGLSGVFASEYSSRAWSLGRGHAGSR